MRRQTPWGMSDDEGRVLADGIISYSTPGHGGIWLSLSRRKELEKVIPSFHNFLDS